MSKSTLQKSNKQILEEHYKLLQFAIRATVANPREQAAIIEMIDNYGIAAMVAAVEEYKSLEAVKKSA